MRRSLGAAALVSALLAVLVGEGGCEIAIGDTVPSFLCNGGASPCPQGQVCDTTHHCVVSCTTPGFAGCPSGTTCNALSGLCQPIGDGGMMDEVSVGDGPGPDVVDDVTDSMSPDADTNPPMETGPDTPGTCPGGILCSCGGDSQCNSKLCVDQLSVGAGLYQAAGSTSFCSQPCCISADCPANTVCYATGQGGNYCVNPMWIGRSTSSGTGQGGASCSLGPRDCRSGLCDGSGHCVDTCCSTGQAANECAGGDTCTFGNFPGANTIDKNYGAYCGSGGGSAGGSSCFSNNECDSNLCAAAMGQSSNHCWNACRNSSDCSSGYYCNYVIASMATPAPIVGACYPTQSNLSMGQTCDPANDMCKGFCDPATNQCTDVCFGDSDCSGVSGWRCRNETLPVQGGGSYSLLCCGP